MEPNSKLIAKALRKRRRMFCKCCRKLKINCVMKVKQGPKIVNRRSLRGVPTADKNEPSLKKLEIEEQKKGSYGWGKIEGSPWWPAIIVTSASCGMDVPRERYHYVFWLGHNTVSEVRTALFYDFKRKFDIFTKDTKFKNIKHLNTGIIEGIKYHAINVGCDVSGLQENELWAWAKKGFDLDKMKKIKPVKKVLPENVVDSLNVIMEKNLKLKKKKFAAEVRALKKKKTAELLSCPKDEGVNLSDTQHASVELNDELFTSIKSEDDRPIVKPQASYEQNENLRLLKEKKISAKELCISCFSKGEIKDEHPLFEGGLCASCLTRYKKFMFYSSNYKKKEICCICFYKGEKIRCLNDDCQGSVCRNCYKDFDELQVEENCLICTQNFDDSNMFIKRRIDKLTKIVSLFSELNTKISKKQSISVITVFDQRLEGFYLMEPLKLPISLHILADGSNMMEVWLKERRNKIRLKPPEQFELSKLKEIITKNSIDLLIGGFMTYDSPIKIGTKEPFHLKGFGQVLFRFTKYLFDLKELQRENHFFWLFFVPATAPLGLRNLISRYLGIEPVSGSGIPRLYWGNIPGMGQTVVPKKITAKFDMPAFSPLYYHLGEFGGWINPERIYGSVPVKTGSFSTEERDPEIKVPDPTTWMGEIEYMLRGLKIIYN